LYIDYRFLGLRPDRPDDRTLRFFRGDALVLLRHRQGHPPRQFGQDCLTGTFDEAERDDNL
jgi:hypothetical protein